MRQFRYFLGRAVESLRARPWPAAVTVATITLAFALLVGYLLLFRALEQAAAAWGERLEVSAYLEDAVGEARGRDLARQVAAWPGVGRVTYVSKTEALARFRAALAGQAVLLEALPGNPLPASIEVALAPELRTAEGIRDLAGSLRGLAGVSDVEYGREEAERLAALLGVVRLAGLAIALVLALAATLIVASTVRLGLYARQDEVEVLRLVGATERFVRAPFLIEGGLQGLAGASLALGLAALAHRVARPSLAALGDFLAPAAAGFLPAETVAAVAGAGMLLGLAGSWLSVRRGRAR